MNDFEMRKMAENYRKLEERIAKLEAYQTYRRNFLSLNEGAIIIKTQDGLTTMTMKKDGSVRFKCKDFEIDASGDIKLGASSDIVMKGSKILQN